MAQYRYTREWDEFQLGSGQLARKMRIIVPPEHPLTEPEGTGVSETRTYSLQTLIMMKRHTPPRRASISWMVVVKPLNH